MEKKMYFSAFIGLLGITSVMADIKSIVKGNEAFGKNIFQTIRSEYDNLIMSPFSAHCVLSMAYAGADGSTANAFKTVLGLKDSDSAAEEYHELMTKIQSMPNTVTLKVANKVYVKQDYKLKPEFNSVMKNKYFSETQQLNFENKEESARTINTWVEDQTNKKIKDLIKSSALDSNTRLVLVNALYFKGKWAKQFNKDDTKKEPFYLLNGQEEMVDMMHVTAEFNYAEDEKLKSKILELPYLNSDISMVIFLPNERDGIKHLEKEIVNFDFSNFNRGMYKTEVIVSLPKFKIESTIEMKKVLKKIGLEEIFSHDANFSKIPENNEPLYVSDVIQKAFIEVNEEGAEAAAATGLIMMTRCMPMPVFRKPFQVDHPFMVAIVHNDNGNNTVAFIGRVTHPDI